MKISNAPREGITRVLRTLTTALFMAGLFSSFSGPPEVMNAPGTLTFAQARVTPTPQPKPGQLSPEELRLREDWRISMAQVPLPKKGCFQSSYPNKAWQEVTCTKAPPYPMVPRFGPRPLVVGNLNDISAQAPTGFISTAIGSFDSAKNVTSEMGQINAKGSQVANAYTLQLNTNFFTSMACAGSPNPGCQGWEQFVFANDGTSGSAYIQYWLIKYNTACPAGAGWNQFSFPMSTDIYCFRNSNNAAVVPNQPITITNLPQLSLSGTVGAGGDSVTLSEGAIVHAATGDNTVNAAAGWKIAEFNLFGDAGGGQANFNAEADIVPRTRIFYGGTAAPLCVAQGFTGETNNLTFGPTAPAASAPGPAVIFRESTTFATSNCANATTVGDTHLTTLGGLFYDFQASGDFVLAQVDPDFVVQTRQVSGAPTWPDASVNSAVATRMGNDRVAICLPGRLNVNGANTDLGDGNSFSTPEGVDIWRRGNIYYILGQSGDSVRATINSSYIDVSVGLGHWPANVTGLLANTNGNVSQIAARDGTVLTNLFSFEAFYNRYGESWRVARGESLLSTCGDGKVESGNPRRPFYAKDLDPQVAERTRAVCTAAGVKAGPLLDACTLDVAVIGNDAAAKVFVGMPDPIAVGNIVTTSGGRGPGFRLWWLLLLIVLLGIAFIVWIVRKRRTTP
jgi:hypothetical protein